MRETQNVAGGALMDTVALKPSFRRVVFFLELLGVRHAPPSSPQR